MDEPGWHARRRAKQEAKVYAHPQKGVDGKYKAVEELEPSRDKSKQNDKAPPTPPPKNGAQTLENFKPRGPDRLHVGVRPPGAEAAQIPGQQPNHPRMLELKQMSPLERSAAGIAPAVMRPWLKVVCGPLLKYDMIDNGVYHGACLLVTGDAESNYDPHPVMLLEWGSLGQPDQANASPIDRHPQQTYPTVHESAMRANGSATGQERSSEAQRAAFNGEELWAYVGLAGTFTFWRFRYSIPLTSAQMRIDYSINSSEKSSFWVPAINQNMNWAAHSCNGFSAGINPDDFRGPGFDSGYDPLWVDLLKRHEQTPYHVLVGGGDQLYCDKIIREPELQEWVAIKGSVKRIGFKMTEEIEIAIDRFYFSHYCNSFQRGAFAQANGTIPMLNMLDDHDLIDGFGSYPEDLQKSPMFRQIGSRGYFYFLLFQCFINDEKDGVNTKFPESNIKSMVVGGLGPYIPFPSHSFVTSLGPKVWIVLLDCRAERRKNQVCSELEYSRVFDRLSAIPEGVEHLIVQIGIPIAYPRMNFLENALESRFNPVTAIAKTGTLAKNFVNKFNADAELLDDLSDHWTASAHKKERNWLVEQFQHLARRKKFRISFLSGDVHCAAVGVFKTLSKRKKDEEPAKDHRWMLNIVTSAIVNTPPPNGVLSMVSYLATRTHRTMHAVETDETMLPLFEKAANGSKAKYKFVAGKRNYTSISRDDGTGELIFDIRVEIEKGNGETSSYSVRAPPPLWTADQNGAAHSRPSPSL